MTAKKTIKQAAEIILGNNTGMLISNHPAITQSMIDLAKWQQEQILEFLYSEITERRDYSASKMCEEIIKFIQQLDIKK